MHYFLREWKDHGQGCNYLFVITFCLKIAPDYALNILHTLETQQDSVYVYGRGGWVGGGTVNATRSPVDNEQLLI